MTTSINLSELSNEEIDRIAITEVLGYKDGAEIGGNYPSCWYPPDCTDPIQKKHVHPTTCRNQSRKVVEAAMDKMGATSDFDRCANAHMIAQCFERAGYSPKICANVEFAYLTAREETLAAVLAVRAVKEERE